MLSFGLSYASQDKDVYKVIMLGHACVYLQPCRLCRTDIRALAAATRLRKVDTPAGGNSLSAGIHGRKYDVHALLFGSLP